MIPINQLEFMLDGLETLYNMYSMIGTMIILDLNFVVGVELELPDECLGGRALYGSFWFGVDHTVILIV